MNNINEIVKSVINEYLTRDMVSLLKYFSLTDEEKKNSLPHEYYYFFNDFLIENDINFTYPTHDFYDHNGKLEKGDKYEDYEIVEWLYGNNKKLFDNFADYLYDRINNNTLNIDDAEYPAWSFFSKPEIIKNQWLIHQTKNADSVAEKGFIYGVDDGTKLGLTTHLGEFEKKYGGYNFAYTLNDFLKYGKSGFNYKYGEEAVVFNASGIRLWHYGDEEYQTIFYGNTARNIIPITHYTSTYDIHSLKTNNILYEGETMEDSVMWLIKNFSQYRKHLS